MGGQKDVRRRMSEKHEAWLADVLGGSRSPGSGNQANNPSDGRQDHRRAPVAFSWDGKATIAQSVSVKLSDWLKIGEQCLNERPMLALRMYLDDRLSTWTDLFVLDPNDLLELLALVDSQRQELIGARQDLDLVQERLRDVEERVMGL